MFCVISVLGAYVVLALWYCILGKVAYVGLFGPAVGHIGPMLEPSWAAVGSNCVEEEGFPLARAIGFF